MESLTIGLALLLKPVLSPVSRRLLSAARPTWQFEAAFVALVLATVAFLTTEWPRSGSFNDLRPALINWISAAAVLGSFLQANVGFRMAEAQEASDSPSVHCHAWSGRYWIIKELLWFLVFLLSGAYAAIAGNALFILWPAWRRIHTLTRGVVRNRTDPG